MLYIVGLGLGDEKDITVRGLEAVKKCSKIYLESYTSLLHGPDSISALEDLYGKPVIVADREMVEQGIDQLLEESCTSNVAFLVVGDPFGATTHSDLVVRARKIGVEVRVIHNASVMNAVGACGLQLYRFGETISIPFFTETWRPDSFYEKIKTNRQHGLHTLCLLDIRVKEPTLESLCRGRKEYEQPKFMTINTAIEQLLEIEQTRGESDDASALSCPVLQLPTALFCPQLPCSQLWMTPSELIVVLLGLPTSATLPQVRKAYNEDTTCVGCARLGSETQKILVGSMKELLTTDFGPPLHCLIIVGKMHPIEEEMLDFYRFS